MKRRATFLALGLVAAFGLAGCGEDNCGDNDNDGGTPQPTVTRTGGVSTVTPTAGPPTVGPTQTGATPIGPTPTPGPVGACEGDALIATLTTQAGGELDSGWTGIAHNSPLQSEVTNSANLDCTGNNCVVDGSALVGTRIGGPLPFSSGGVPVCVTNTFREAVTGTYDCSTGCGEIALHLTSAVFLVQNSDQPCPNCVGDATPNDGQKGGTCAGNTTTPGAACDVNGVSPGVFGSTSNDCEPTGSPISNLIIDITPVTTGTFTQTPAETCVSVGSIGNCYCPGQNRPNACNDGICPASGVCEGGPIDGLCSGARHRSCTPGSGTSQCEDTFPGFGTCENSPRPCFGQTISRTGQCGTQQGVLVGFFCIPETNAPAVNTTAGLPGPGALTIPARSVRVPR